LQLTDKSIIKIQVSALQSTYGIRIEGSSGWHSRPCSCTRSSRGHHRSSWWRGTASFLQQPRKASVKIKSTTAFCFLPSKSIAIFIRKSVSKKTPSIRIWGCFDRAQSKTNTSFVWT